MFLRLQFNEYKNTGQKSFEMKTFMLMLQNQ